MNKNFFFNRALNVAPSILGKKGRVLVLLTRLGDKLRKVRVKDLKVKEKFAVLGRLLKAYILGKYREIPWKTLLLITAAILYFVNPIDIIPDWIPGLGLTDDFGILLTVYTSITTEIDKFLTWGEIPGEAIMKTALLAGATGLIGKQLLQLLLNSERYTKIVALTRQDLPQHAKLVQVKVEFGKISERASGFKVDDVFCCLGTTMAKAGSKENFYQVDFYYPLLLAKTSRTAGAKQYLLVSALGANNESKIYYNQVKGEIEEAIRNVGFETVHIFRPSLLLGPRSENRSGEDAAKFLYKVFGFLIPKKYKAIDSGKVARGMLHFASTEEKGVHIHESSELQLF